MKNKITIALIALVGFLAMQLPTAIEAAIGALPVGAGIYFVCQTSQPAPVGKIRYWTRCSDGHRMWSDASNVDHDQDASGVTAGSYTSANITVGADGRVTAASNGTGGSGGGQLWTRTAVADTSPTVAPTNTAPIIAAFTSITAPRTVTGTTAGSATNPAFLRIVDESGSVSSTNTITFAPSSGLIDGQASKVVLETARGEWTGYCDGVNWHSGMPLQTLAQIYANGSGASSSTIAEDSTRVGVLVEDRSPFGTAGNTPSFAATDSGGTNEYLYAQNGVAGSLGAWAEGTNTGGNAPFRFQLSTNTASTAGTTVQNGVPFQLNAHAWQTSNSSDIGSLWYLQARGVTGSTASGKLFLSSQLTGGSFIDQLTLDTSGNLDLLSGFINPNYNGTSTNVPTITWTNITGGVGYVNGWDDFGSLGSVGSYYKDKLGVIHLRGWLKGTTIATTAFTLPAGYRPAAYLQFPTTCDSSNMGLVQITSTGVVSIYDAAYGTGHCIVTTTLDSVQFEAAN